MGNAGVTAGLMSMVRWQNVLFAVIPVCHGLVESWRAAPSERVKTLRMSAGVFAVSAAVTFVPQLVFWKVARGTWFSLPSGAHAVRLTSLHIGDVLFSPNHGLLSWTPLIYLALVGLPLFFRRDRLMTAVLIGGFLAQVYINSTVEIWWGGSGFGARRFANCALVFAVGLASLLRWFTLRPLVTPAVIVGVLLCGNVIFMLDVRNQSLPSEEGVTFDTILDSFYARVGNPFSFPLNAYVAWRTGAGLPLYDRLGGRTYNNLTIDFGESDDGRFLGVGWSGRERAATHSFRWATGPHSTVVVPLVEPDEYELHVVWEPFVYPGGKRQWVDVFVNGELITRFLLRDGTHAYEARIPARVLRHNLNKIRFAYGYAMSPQAAGLSDDRRELAVQFDTLRLRRIPSTPRRDP